MAITSSDLPTADDPLWAAFCYAAGELPSAESEAFEGQLAVDQNLREQLARAVQILEAVRLAEDHVAVAVALAANPSSGTARSTVRRFARLRRRLLWTLAAAAAVCVAFFTGLRLAEQGQPGGRRPAPQDIAESRPVDDHGQTPAVDQLITLWAQAAAESNDEFEADNAMAQAFAAIETTRRADLDPSIAMDEAGQEFTVPGWMLIAVSGSAPDAGESDASDTPLPERSERE